MNKFIILLCSLFIFSCATSSRGIAETSVLCTPKSLQSGDVNLYWKIEAGETVESSMEDICKVGVMDLHPTQFAVGIIDVQKKAAAIQAMSASDQEKYLRKNPEPIVIGPLGEFYIIDHHHLARALDDSHIAKTYGIILENWNGTNVESFWAYMKSKNWVYLVDQNGNTKTIDDLMKIKTVGDLQDDPYRTLAGFTRCKVEAKCEVDQWLKQPVPFIEFLWAEHFRKTPAVSQALKQYGTSQFDKVVASASLEVKRLKGKLPVNEIQ